MTTRAPKRTLLLCLLLAVLSVEYSVFKLGLQPDRSALVSAELPWNARYADYKRHFDRWDDVILCIEGDAADRSIDILARDVAAGLEGLPEVWSADAGFNPTDHPRMFRTAPASLSPENRHSFDSALQELSQLKRMAVAPNANAALLTALQPQAEGGRGADRLGELNRFLDPYLTVIRGEPGAFEPAGPGANAFETFSTTSGRIRLVFIQLNRDENSASGVESSLATVRSRSRELLKDYDRIEWGITGIPAIEADETRQSIIDSTRASVLALVLITILMLVVFRGVIVPLFALMALLTGVGWSFGWLVLSVGHLQLLSVVFSVVLLGLGIDFAVHIIARLEIVHDDFDTLDQAVESVFQSVGPGLLTGAITTAAAFLTIALTDFKGAAELGIISGGGVVLCLIAVMCCFPALLALMPDWKKSVRARKSSVERSRLARPLFFVIHHPLPTVIVACAIIGLLGWRALQLRYDPNLLNLHPPHIESVVWEEKLIEEDALSVWSALSIVEPEQAEARAEAFRRLDVVSSVGGMGALFPPNHEQREARIAELRRSQVTPMPFAPGYDALAGLVRQVRGGLASRLAELDEDDPERSSVAGVIGRIDHAFDADVPQQARQEAWTAFNQSFLAARDDYRAFLDAALAPGELSAGDLPRAMRAMWIGDDGRWLLRIYPTGGEKSVLHPDRLEPFVSQLRTVDPQLLGPPVQIYESSKLIQSAYIRAAVYALGAVLLLLLFDFRSLTDPLCAVLPVIVGFIGAFGLMEMFNVPLNFANMIVMPIILGIGVDAGVHVVHRWRDEPHGQPPGLSGGTGRGITLTMITTMIGFGCMMIAEHRGIRSLGFVMVVGLGATLLACYTLLSAILALRRANGANGPNG